MNVGDEQIYRLRDDALSERVRILAIHPRSSGQRYDVEFHCSEEAAPKRRLSAGILLQLAVGGGCQTRPMIELITSASATLANSFAQTAARGLQSLVPSGLAWIALFSLDGDRQPGQVLQAAIQWSGLSWSIAPVLTWLHNRNDATHALALLLVLVSACEVRSGAGSWLANNRAVTASTAGLVLLIEAGVPVWELFVLVSAGPLFAAIHERRMDSGVLVLCIYCLLLAGPVLFLADFLGRRDKARQARHSNPTVANADRTANVPDRLHIPRYRPSSATPGNSPAVSRLRSGPLPSNLTPQQARHHIALLRRISPRSNPSD